MSKAAYDPLLGFIFDLDGTLVDSHLDFDAMRREMGLPIGKSILEAFEQMDEIEAARCSEILNRHELNGAAKSTVIAGVSDFLRILDSQKVLRAVVTRNSRSMAEVMLARCSLRFDVVITREDGPAKPDPWAIQHICALWGIDPNRAAIIGDFHFDIEAGLRAGATTVFLPGAVILNN